MLYMSAKYCNKMPPVSTDCHLVYEPTTQQQGTIRLKRLQIRKFGLKSCCHNQGTSLHLFTIPQPQGWIQGPDPPDTNAPFQKSLWLAWTTVSTNQNSFSGRQVCYQDYFNGGLWHWCLLTALMGTSCWAVLSAEGHPKPSLSTCTRRLQLEGPEQHVSHTEERQKESRSTKPLSFLAQLQTSELLPSF